MGTVQQTKSFRHFAKHLFLVSKVYSERNKAKNDVDAHLKRMKNSIIKMRLGYKDIDSLREKVQNLVSWERKYARFFKPEDRETHELKNQINALEHQLKNGREEKQKMVYENNEKIRQLTESLNNVKSQMRHLMMDKAKRHHRLKALEQKISEKVDVHTYFHS